MARRTLFVVSACLTVAATLAFRPSHRAHSGRTHRLEAALSGDDSASALSRRRAVGAAAAALATTAFGARTAFAAQDDKDLTRIVKGVKNIDALLGDWEAQTTKVCSEGEKYQGVTGAGCPRNPDKVPQVLGMRSTEDPLFQIEKVFKAGLTSGTVEDIDAWEGAVEGWTTHSSDAREFAYTASFGEYNPGGGKDAVLKYLELSREALVKARADLASIAKQLDLSV